MSERPVIRIWLNQQTVPPEIEVDGIRYPVEAFSVRFDYEAGTPYRGQFSCAMDRLPFNCYSHDSMTIICEGWQWRGRIASVPFYNVKALWRYSQEIEIALVGPVIPAPVEG